jgi:hypothetical protein
MVTANSAILQRNSFLGAIKNVRVIAATATLITTC